MRRKLEGRTRHYVNRLIKKVLRENRYIINRDGTVYKNTKAGLKKLGVKGANGYIIIRTSLTSISVHRLVYAKYLGELNSRLVINHKDGDKTNNNVDNLEQITKSANCKHSFRVLHRLPSASNTKFTKAQIDNIRELHNQGKSYTQIMKIYPTSKSNISYIINHKTWYKKTYIKGVDN